ncbi:MAG TPA: transposase, partial [Polyangiaceae bacterium]|nr:transposase [Polyangiaceae bacterium]
WSRRSTDERCEHRVQPATELAHRLEHIHDVSKNELGAGTPPSSRFGVNAAWYRLCLIACNVLSAMKALALPSNLSSARPKKLRFALLNLAGKIASHAGDLILRVTQAAERLVNLVAARARLLVWMPART